MSGGIYLIQDSGGLVEMTEQTYDSEDLLQGLLAKYPNLLAGDQIDITEPRRWMLVSREVPLASEEDGAGRWSVDHLFLDQDAIPTIVEVKRSTDTRIRREVVGQMLDYAANAVVYWPVEDLRSRLRENRADPEQDLMDFLEDPDTDPEAFWQKVKTNLQAGRMRLIFVADEIPSELRRIVEFLNQQMDPAEVLAVEIKQYVSQDSSLKTLVPRVIGQTVEAQQKKSGAIRESRQWDEASFFQDLEARRGTDEVRVARKLLEWAKTKGLRIWWGKGSKDGSFFPMLDYQSETHWTISVWTYGRLEIQFQWMQTKPPFDDESKRMELRRRLNEITGIDLPADKITKRPSVLLSTLKDEAALKQFLEALDWFVREVKVSCLMSANAVQLERYRGSLLGLAAGDALGAPLEGLPPGSFTPVEDMMGGGFHHLDPGYWTDDTSMALCLAESLIEKRSFDPVDQLERYLRWFREGHLSSTGVCFGIGNTTMEAILRFEETRQPYAGSTNPNKAGNGSIMRLAPVPLFFAQRPKEAIERSAESSRTTHGAATAVDACRYFGALLIGAANGAGKDELLSERYSPAPDHWEENRLHPEVDEVASGSFKRKEPPEIKGTGYAVKSLEAALWAFHNSNSFEEGCLRAVNLGDDADTTAAVYGQLAGAFYGEGAIPERWLAKLAHRGLIEDYAEGLFAQSRGGDA